MPTPSALSLRALDFCQSAVDRGIRGGIPGYGRFRGLEVDGYQVEAGLELPAVKTEQGWPWCMAAQYAASKAVETEDEKSCCPRTGGTLKAAERFPEYAKLPGPQKGAIFILKHHDGKTGHAGRVKAVFEDGTIDTLEGDTNVAGSTTGDHWGEHRWNPADGSRGTLLGYWDDGIPAPAAPLVAEKPAEESTTEPVSEDLPTETPPDPAVS